MPYSLSNPPDKIKGLSEKKQRQWIHVFNEALDSGDDEGTAHAKAWGVVKKACDCGCGCGCNGQIIGPTENEGSLADAIRNQDILNGTSHMARELLVVAKSLIADVTLSQGDDYRRVMGDAIRNGEVVTFLYRKKDGSTRQVRIQPQVLLGDKGVRGIDVDDSAKTPKVFMFEGIGGGERTVRQEEPEVPSVIVLRGNETQHELERIMGRAIKQKIPVKMEYASKDDGGHWIRKEIEEVPLQYGRVRTTNGIRDGVRFTSKIVPWNIIGEYHSVVRRWEKMEEERQQRELRNGEALKQLIEMLPGLKNYWYDVRRSKKGIEEAWDTINGTGSADISLGTRSEVIDGPYGAMENVQMRDIEATLIIRSGTPMDKNRMKIEEISGREYWRDDEGNESSGRGYGRRW